MNNELSEAIKAVDAMSEKQREAEVDASMRRFIGTKDKLHQRYGNSERFFHFYMLLVDRHFGPPVSGHRFAHICSHADDDNTYLAEIFVVGFGLLSVVVTSNNNIGVKLDTDTRTMRDAPDWVTRGHQLH